MKKLISLTIIAVWLAQISWAQNNPIFYGGSGDGQALASYAQIADADLFIGGQGQGWTKSLYQQLDAANIYIGGEGQGWTKSLYQQLDAANIYIGGEGQGWAKANYAQIADATLFLGGDGDGWAGTYLAAGPLPLELLNFTGQTQDELHLLNWQTILNTKLSHFVVEHSNNGNTFFELGMVTANNNSSNEPYSFINKKPVIGNNFYKLKLVKPDGTFTYSNTVLLSISADKYSVIIYPNPTASAINISIESEGTAQANIRITDMQGKQIFAEQLATKVNSTSIDMSAWPSGIYNVQIQKGNLLKTIRVIKK